MAGRQGLPADARRAARLPERQRIEKALHHAFGAPEHQGVAGDGFTALAAQPVVLQVDAGAGPVVLAGAVDGVGPAEAALVFGQCLVFDVAQAARAPAAELGV
ncbi:hypothetical protein FQZ97_1077450 [compost metagenome]